MNPSFQLPPGLDWSLEEAERSDAMSVKYKVKITKLKKLNYVILVLNSKYCNATVCAATPEIISVLVITDLLIMVNLV